MRKGSLAAVIMALLGCASDNSAPTAAPVDASTPCTQPPASSPDGATCTPLVSPCWTPTWKPPKAPVPNACTEAQIMEDVTKCHGDTRNDADCDVFQRDPSNGTCLECLYSTEDEPSYGAVILLADGSSRVNVPGCVALWSSDSTQAGCGARMQALDQCEDEACKEGCASFDERVACARKATNSACANFLRDTACWQRPNYVTCTNQATFEDYFVTLARIFCVSGVNGGVPSDAGAQHDGDAAMNDAAEGQDVGDAAVSGD